MENKPPSLPLVAALHTPCKCCGRPAELYGVVDFHKNCNIKQGNVLPLSGIPIYYHQCAACGFIFTSAFDGFSPEDFARHIYNSEYIQVDPQYLDVRPNANAKEIAYLLKESKSIRILDYGGGSGHLAARLRSLGFADVYTYDPFVPESAARPTGKFDLVLSYEVAEHSPTPRETFSEMTSFLNEQGIVVFSTLVQPPQIDQIGVLWWYIAPRNGHVSIYSANSLRALANPLGFQLLSFNQDLHVLCRELPSFASHWGKTPVDPRPL